MDVVGFATQQKYNAPCTKMLLLGPQCAQHNTMGGKRIRTQQ